eukprot:scaffold401_cov399-Prasinococcus_capsulatus_cf.AAC.43
MYSKAIQQAYADGGHVQSTFCDNKADAHKCSRCRQKTQQENCHSDANPSKVPICHKCVAASRVGHVSAKANTHPGKKGRDWQEAEQGRANDR